MIIFAPYPQWGWEVVVAYCPDHEDGFLYVDETFRQGPNPEIPIRVRTLRLDEITE